MNFEFEWDLALMSLVIFVPTLAAIVLLFVPRGQEETMRWISLFGTAITLVLSIWMFIDYRADVVDFYLSPTSEAESSLNARAARADLARAESRAQGQSRHDWVARHPWIQRFGIDYYLGVDGISLSLVLLTTVLSFLAMIASWKIDRYVRGYCVLFLLLETGMLGTFLALDFFLFYIFWEIMLLPMYFLIGVWGGPRREYAAIKFFLYTLLGSVFILIAMLGFYFTDVRDYVPEAKVDLKARELEKTGLSRAQAQAQASIHSFDFLALNQAGEDAALVLNGQIDKTQAMKKAGTAEQKQAVRER